MTGPAPAAAFVIEPLTAGRPITWITPDHRRGAVYVRWIKPARKPLRTGPHQTDDDLTRSRHRTPR